jgi:hypothetical protein
MKPSVLPALCVALCLCACAKGTPSGPTLAAWGRALFKKEDPFASSLTKKQDRNLVRLARQRAEQEAVDLEPGAPFSRRGVPPSMYRTTEPPLPEPDLSLPVSDIPRSVPTASPPSEQ